MNERRKEERRRCIRDPSHGVVSSIPFHAAKEKDVLFSRDPCYRIFGSTVFHPVSLLRSAACAICPLVSGSCIHDFANRKTTDFPYLSCLVNTLLGLPSVSVSSGVRVSVELSHIGQHGVEDTGVGGRSRLHIHVDWAGVVDSLDSRHLESQRLY